jgi:predicted nucleotidyltransferase component of viral defense system
MRVSLEQLLETASATGFRPEILEKVIQLMHLLGSLQDHPFLRGKFALRGGTALNLFHFEIPRLSVDIDMDYIGATDVEVMKVERPVFEKSIQAVCSREGFTTRWIPQGHAGGKWQLRYQSAYGGEGNLELDINYMFRVQLWPIEYRD